MAMVLWRTESSQAWMIRRTMLRLRPSLTETTLSMMRKETLASSAIRSSSIILAIGYTAHMTEEFHLSGYISFSANYIGWRSPGER
jgi:hypothetical protein